MSVIIFLANQTVVMDLSVVNQELDLLRCWLVMIDVL